uniref:Uncharacterized protein n=1 Tax=viral metagenome TaxID=1070528 RepID=A0A6C0LVL0_9ZZZZ
MATVIEQNIFPQYCISTRVPGMTCPALRRGLECTWAHRRDEINPNVCRRDGKCRARERCFPFTCTYIHKGETKDEYSHRLDFDPNDKKYNDLQMYEVKQHIDDCDNIIEELNEKLINSNHSNSYWKRTKASIHHLKIKRRFLSPLLEKKIVELDEWAKKEAYEDRRDKYRDQYLESLGDDDDRDW